MPVSDIEAAVGAVGEQVAAAFPPVARHPVRALDERAMTLASTDAELRAALFRFVDVVPACRGVDDLARHLLDHLERLDDPPAAVRAALRMEGPAARRALGVASAAGVRHMAHRFIVGETPRGALGLLRHLWDHGAAATLDLLGEATVTRAEADRYAARCADALTMLVRAYADFPTRPVLERDALGPLPRANLSVKVSALTPRLKPGAPERGKGDAATRLRPLLRQARELGAHVHIDMESLDTREATLELVLELLDEPEFADGPSAGLVVQAYLRDSGEELDQILRWARASTRRPPLVVRLVKGAYWDHEVSDSRQHGWAPPVYTVKAVCDANFEALTVRLLEARPLVRVAVASHNLRSIAHAVACSRALGAADSELELQVLRGLGDDLQHALSSLGLRVRTYCPVGDLVAGMAYLVRRLLENTSNESFLAAQHAGRPLAELLAPPLVSATSSPAPR